MLHGLRFVSFDVFHGEHYVAHVCVPAVSTVSGGINMAQTVERAIDAAWKQVSYEHPRHTLRAVRVD